MIDTKPGSRAAGLKVESTKFGGALALQAQALFSSKMRRVATVVWVLLACLWLTSCGSDSGVPAEVRALVELDTGIELEDASNFQRAHNSYNAAIDLDPGLAEAYARRGNSFLRFEKMSPAMADLNMAIELDPELAIAYLYRGVFMATVQRPGEASLAFSKSIELDPSNVETYLQRSRFYVEQSEPDSGLADLDSAIALDAEAVDVYMERAALHLRIGNTANAAADFEQVLAMSQNEEQVQVARQMLAIIR